MRHILTVLTTVILAGCATSTAVPQDSTTVTGSKPTVTSAVQSTTTTNPVPVETTTTTLSTTTTIQSQQTTTTVAVSSTTASPSPTSTAPEPATMLVAPYFYIDETGHTGHPGPFLFPMAREVERSAATGRAALVQLFAGPSQAERDGVPTISTAIPAGVRVLALTITEDIATVDLSSEFAATEDSPAAARRVAQVVFTLARFDSVAEVVFRQEGRPVSVPIGDGRRVDRPVGIHDYLEFAAALSIESPMYGGPAGNPLHVAGFGAAFEAAFNYALTDNEGLIIEEGHAMTNNGMGWGGFDFTIRYRVDRPQTGSLILWAESAENGQRIDIREYPVLLTP